MKKIICMILAVLLITSASVMVTSAADWEMAGDITATFVADAASKITFDGDFSDMVDAGAKKMTLDQINMCPWTGEVPDDWSIELYALADADYLYIGFWIKDDYVTCCLPDTFWGADAFQLALDFLDKNEENDLDIIFYSFGLQETEDIQLILDGPRAGRDHSVVYYSEDAKEVKGTAVYDGTEIEHTGWKAEFALSWEMLLDDLNYKLESKGINKIESIDLKNGVSMDILLCYINYDGKTQTGAFGTSAEYFPGPAYDGYFDADNAGLTINVKTDESIIINCAENRVEEEDTDPSEDNTSSTEAASTTEAATTTTEAATTTTEAATTTTEAATTTVKAEETKKNDNEKPGCKSVVTGALVLLTSISLAGVALKKKH